MSLNFMFLLVIDLHFDHILIKVNREQCDLNHLLKS